jgi:hypothetical protein
MLTNARCFAKLCSKSASVGICSVLFFVAGCGLGVEQDFPIPDPKRTGEDVYKNDLDGSESTIFGDGGLDLFNLGGNKRNQQGGGSGIAVNSYLWRASLDTIAFMPLSSADPFGGVIITDWYSPPEVPGERYKMSVYILGRQLRADGIKVAVFRQQTKGPNVWLTKSVSKNTATNLENKILTRARQLRLTSAKNSK